MANRSDVNSKLPRQIKRLLIMSSIIHGETKAEAREARMDFIAAHAHYRDVLKKRMSSKNEDIGTPEATPEA